MGYSFNEIAVETSVSVNTLLSCKHYAMLQLCQPLLTICEEFLKGEDKKR
jgi:hypothetical protein